jgi:hypothetical protein
MADSPAHPASPYNALNRDATPMAPPLQNPWNFGLSSGSWNGGAAAGSLQCLKGGEGFPKGVPAVVVWANQGFSPVRTYTTNTTPWSLAHVVTPVHSSSNMEPARGRRSLTFRSGGKGRLKRPPTRTDARCYHVTHAAETPISTTEVPC